MINTYWTKATFFLFKHKLKFVLYHIIWAIKKPDASNTIQKNKKTYIANIMRMLLLISFV